MNQEDTDNVVSFQSYKDKNNDKNSRRNQSPDEPDVPVDISIEQLTSMIESLSSLAGEQDGNFSPVMFFLNYDPSLNNHGNDTSSNDLAKISTSDMMNEVVLRLLSEGREDLAELVEEIRDMYSHSYNELSEQIPLFNIENNDLSSDINREVTITKEEEEQARNIINLCSRFSKE